MKLKFKDGTIIEVSDSKGKSKEEIIAEAKKVYKDFKDSQSQEIGRAYRNLSKKYGCDMDELIYGEDGFMQTCYPNGFPDFSGDVIYNEKYWNEFIKWAEENHKINFTNKQLNASKLVNKVRSIIEEVCSNIIQPENIKKYCYERFMVTVDDDSTPLEVYIRIYTIPREVIDEIINKLNNEIPNGNFTINITRLSNENYYSIDGQVDYNETVNDCGKKVKDDRDTYEVEISKEGFGKNNTERSIILERKQFNSFEEADDYAFTKAKEKFEELKTNKNYEDFLFDFAVLDPKYRGRKYRVNIKNGKKVELLKYEHKTPGEVMGIDDKVIDTFIRDSKKVKDESIVLYPNEKKSFEIEYPNLEITYSTVDIHGDWVDYDATIDFTLELSESDVIDALYNIIKPDDDFFSDYASDEDDINIDEIIENNIFPAFDYYYNELKDYFEETARDEAAENIDDYLPSDSREEYNPDED